ncbi:MAG: efflux RND transporter periplasmic adaptor subunit [Candidatus Omnitrophica bacterium]|nr:efflux RND transporter periplasmic adaptor subunit [Candidatus Omnitrophota bacterium]
MTANSNDTPEKNIFEKAPVQPRKKGVFKVLIWIVILFAAYALISPHITFKNGLPMLKKKKVIQKQTAEEIPVPVKGFRVSRIDFTDTLPALGTIKGYREIELKFAEAGYIEYINFRDGEKAIEGDIIASLDQREALLKLEYAKNELERNQKLFDLGSIVESKLQQSKLEYQSARLEYEKTNLVAAYDGYIGTTQKQKGDYVNQNDIFGTFVNLTDAYVEFGIIEKDVNKVKVGQPVTLTVDSYPQDTFSGEIESISPVVEGRTRTFKVKARIVNEDEKLKAGMFGRVGVLNYEKDNTLVIPSAAFRKKEQEYFVYVVHAEGGEAEEGQAPGAPVEAIAPAAGGEVIQGTIEVRPIQIAYATPDAVEIKAGLDDGEIIVADLQQELEEKSKVEVTEIQEHIF